MKTLKNIISSYMLILFSAFSYAQEPAIITLVSSKNIQDASQLVVDLKGEISTGTWNKTYMRIVMKIKANGMSHEVAKYLTSKGRFVISTLNLDKDNTLLYMPNLSRQVLINGRKLSEDISYQLFVPENIDVKIRSQEELLACKTIPYSLIKPVKQLEPFYQKLEKEEKQKAVLFNPVLFKGLKKGDRADFLKPYIF